MQARQAILALLLVALINTWPSSRPRVHAQEKATVYYICTMDGAVLEEKPGSCPICKMTLQPVFIETAFACPVHGDPSLAAKEGVCRIDKKRPLVPVVVNHFWDCGEKPEMFYTAPRKCADGKAAVEKHVIRAHGDHNPKHGGFFFMAEDQWHHLEGTFPKGGPLRVHLYDNFTKELEPTRVRAMIGRAILQNKDLVELESVPLVASKDGKTLEARFKNPAPPAKVTARIKFAKETREQPFEFPFDGKITTEPAAPTTPSAAITTAAANTTPAAPKPAASPAKPTTPAPTPAVATATSQERPAPVGAVPDVAASALTLTRADATSLAQDLPNNTAELLKLLDLRANEVQTLIQDGNFGMVYVPTMLAKEVALALQDHASELPARQHVPLTSAVRQLILASWRLDQYGDLGDREKITQAHSVFAAATAAIKAAYAAR